MRIMEEIKAEVTVENKAETPAQVKAPAARKPRAAKPKTEAKAPAVKLTAEEAAAKRAEAKAAAALAAEVAKIPPLLRKGERKAPGGGVTILNRVGNTRSKGHGLRDHGPSEGGGKRYYCSCGFEEGQSKTLPDARNVHQVHLGLGKKVAKAAEEPKPKAAKPKAPAARPAKARAAAKPKPKTEAPVAKTEAPVVKAEDTDAA
jgi:membrane protein involved in colicin uptake